MLTGRESLIRVIGKRRRFLPNFPRLLSSSLRNNQNDTELYDSATAITPSIEKISCSSSSNVVAENGYVTCPVCGTNIRGDDYTVNNHIDLCLVRGTKRKLSQRTLLQFNFCSRLKIKTHVDESDHARTEEFHIGPNRKPTLIDFPQMASIGAYQEPYGNIQRQMARAHDLSPCRPLLDSVRQHETEGLMEKNVINMVNSPPLSLRPGSPNFDMGEVPGLLSGLSLETYIVGRRFADVADVVSGERISLLRDPVNIKDANAIKGLITSVPKTSLDIVPIEIMCLQTIPYEEVGKDNLPIFKSLCENVISSINSGKKSPPTIAKYQQNFCLIIDEALRNNLHLFTDDEKKFLESFSLMSDDGQRLFVRLYSRKGPWFRICNLSYPEILDYQQAANELTGASYVCSFGRENEVDVKDMKELLNILTVNELCEILRMLKKDSNGGMRKKDLIESLHSSYKDGLCPLLPRLILERTGMWIQISSIAESLLWRVQRLFFLNGEQDMSSFLLVDLGKVKYPEYKCVISGPVFSKRSDWLAYEEAIEVAQIMDQTLDEDDPESISQCIDVAKFQLSSTFRMNNQSPTLEPVAVFLQCFSASWVYSKVILLGVSYFEQERRYQDAIKLLKLLLNNFTSDGRRGYWTLRLSIDLEHIGCIEESISVAEDGVLDPWVRAGSKIALQRRVLRLGKPPRRWKTPSYAASVKRKIPEVHIQGRPLSSKIGIKSRFYGEDGAQCAVEELALQFYAGEGGGWQGVHTESGIWFTIYGLLMWDIIFAEVPNVFRTRFQNAPLDLETDNFYVARTTLIECHLEQIHEGMAEAILVMSWESHLGTVCRGVNWERHSLSELRAAVTCIGGPCLANMCRLLAQDYRSWSGGMPDLLLWRFHGEYNGEAKLVEVKGPRDRLSEQQRAWLLTLMDCGFTAEVCKVNPPAPSALSGYSM